MRRMLTAASTYRLVLWSDVENDDLPVSPTLAAGWLRSWIRDPAYRSEVNEALEGLVAAHRSAKGWMDERELHFFALPRIERALMTGELVLVERPKDRGPLPKLAEPPPEEVKPTEKQSSGPTRTWIEFFVEDDSGDPVEGARWEAELSDGSKHKGVTGKTGLVRFDGIDAGICQFTLVDYDAEEVESADEAKPTEALEVELLSPSGKPIDNVEMVVKLKDGSEKKLVTDGSGKGRLPGLEKGEYEVYFSDLTLDHL